jgi:hypothetical protein
MNTNKILTLFFLLFFSHFAFAEDIPIPDKNSDGIKKIHGTITRLDQVSTSRKGGNSGIATGDPIVDIGVEILDAIMKTNYTGFPIYHVMVNETITLNVASRESFKAGDCVLVWYDGAMGDSPDLSMPGQAGIEKSNACNTTQKSSNISSSHLVTVPTTSSGGKAQPFNNEAYNRLKASKAVVLVAINWSRKWGCSGYQNAQIKSISFDHMPVEKSNDESPADILLNDAPLVFTKSDFDNYAFIVEPGNYALSSFDIKVAESITKIGGFKTPRSMLIKDKKALGGHFHAEAGEVVYIGHFFLDCALQQPVIWRYYVESRDGFEQYLKAIQKAFPTLDTEQAKFRLFETTEFGKPYTLP